ncbi:MAG: hypothetical protein ED557_09820 [Balneola sp.]|nr:MAG: hypothetical protein ED557_09820 [Balneola sp.]
MKKKLIIFFISTSILLILAWYLFLGPPPTFTYGNVTVCGGLAFSTPGVVLSGQDFGIDSMYGYVFDLRNNLFFHTDSFLMAGNYVEYEREVSTYLEEIVLLTEVVSDTSRFGIPFTYLVSAEKKELGFLEYQHITLRVNLLSINDRDFFPAGDNINFYSSMKNLDELDAHLDFFRSAKATSKDRCM